MTLRKPDMFVCQTCLFFSQTVGETAPVFCPRPHGLSLCVAGSIHLDCLFALLLKFFFILEEQTPEDKLLKQVRFLLGVLFPPAWSAFSQIVSFPGRKCDSEGMQLQSLSPREAEPGGELWGRNTVLLLGNACCLRHQSHTRQCAFEYCAPQNPNPGMEG